MLSRVLRYLGVVIALLALPAMDACAQGNLATLSGIVEDASRARIQGAGIRLVHVLTGAQSECVTDESGVFYLPRVMPGSYTLQIERPGFATAQVTGLIVNAGENRSLLIRLRVGSVTETVEIDAASLQIDTVSAAVGTTLDRKIAASIPVNGRSFQDLITLTPGVLTQSPQTLGGPLSANGGLSVNGQKTNANSFLVDGVSGNFGSASLSGARKVPSDGSEPALTAIGTTQSLASIDALEEFRVLASGYSAEYGGAPGAQFVLETRSGAEAGARAIHGGGFNSRRYSMYDGLNWFDRYYEQNAGKRIFLGGRVEKIPYIQNGFGGTVGFSLPPFRPGGLLTQTYVFSSLEAIRVSQPSPYQTYFAPSYFIYQQVPAALQSLLYDFPMTASNYDIPLPTIQVGVFSPMPARLSALAIRLDSRLSARTVVFGRYTRSPSSNEELALTSVTETRRPSLDATLGITTQLSSHHMNDLRAGYARSDVSSSTSLAEFEYSYPDRFTDLLSDLGIPSPHTSGRGEAYIHLLGYGESMLIVDQASSSLRQWNGRDVFSAQAGNHLLQLGVDNRHIASGVTSAPLSVEADFFSADSLVTNRASAVTITRSVPEAMRFNEFSAFVQDTWKLSKVVTMSPGVRWEFAPAPRGSDGADAYTLLGSLASPSTLRLARRGTPLWHASWYNFGPRIGAAWSVIDKPGRETVVRGGAGVYFGSDNGAAAQAFNALGFSATRHFVDVPIPVTAEQLDFTTAVTAPHTDALVFAFPHHFQLPYTLQWNVSIDRALGQNQMVSAAWVASSGHHLLQEQRTNIHAQNSDFGEVSYFPSGVSSSYESFQTKYERKVTPGVQALASYVWAHAIDFGSTAPEFPLTRGNSDLDVRHNLQLAVAWQQHPRGGNWIGRHMLAGWNADARITARSSFPVTLAGNLFSDAATGDRYYSGVDRVPGRALYLHGAQFPGRRAFNGGPDADSPAFTLPDGTAPGDAPRNVVRGFGDVQMNAAVGRDLHFTRWSNLQLRGEAYNLANHPEFGYIEPVVSNALFGQATMLLNQSLGSAGPLYQPGGPRSVQFSARIQF